MDQNQLSSQLQNSMSCLKRAKFTKNDPSGIKGSEKFVLIMISKLGKGQSILPSQVAKEMGVTMAAVTHHLNAMEEMDLIKRTKTSNDRRVSLVHLTKKGEGKLKEFEKNYLKKINELVDYLGKQDTIELIRLLNKIAEFFTKEENA